MNKWGFDESHFNILQKYGRIENWTEIFIPFDRIKLEYPLWKLLGFSMQISKKVYFLITF